MFANAVRPAAGMVGGVLPGPSNYLYEFLFDDYSGSDITNSGTEENGLLIGSASIDTSLKIGGHNSLKVATSRTQTAHGMELVNSAGFDPREQHYISFWFYRPINWEHPNVYYSLLTKGSAYINNSISNRIYDRATNSEVWVNTEYGSIIHPQEFTVYVGEWTHIILENDIDSQEARLYINNQLIDTAALINKNPTAYNLRFGLDYGNEYSWWGNLGLFRISQDELTTNIRNALYAEGLQ